jgi:uncharacterized protein YprB with RNaseH-like and TPR domain
MDIETTGFNRKTDKILVISCANSRSSSVKSFYGTERTILTRFCKYVRLFDSIVTWNGASFDISFIENRCQMYGIQFQRNEHIDLMKLASKIAPDQRLTLDNFIKLFKIDTQKSDFSPITWQMARSGDENAIEYVVDHCERDALALKKLWSKVMG